MNNPRMNQIIDRLYVRNHVNINEGFIKDRKELNKYSGEFQKFLDKKKFRGYSEMGVDDGKIFVEVDGDWKHEHLYFKQLAREFFEKLKGHEISMGEVVTHEYGDDSYVANHYIAIQEGIMEDYIDKDVTVSQAEVDNMSDEKPYNEFIETITNVMGEDLVKRLGMLLNKFSSTPLDNIQMSKMDPEAVKSFLESQLVVFILNDGLSTDEVNQGVVAVLVLPSGKIHLLDTEVLEGEDKYINTILYNMYQLDSISKEVWIGMVDLKG